MSAILKIRENAVWFPRIGLFEWGTERIQEYLYGHEDVVKIFTSPTAYVYTDLSALDQASFAALHRATSQAVEKAFNEVTTLEGNSVAYFASDLHALCQLKMLLSIDQRIGINPETGSLILDDEIVWPRLGFTI